MATRNVMTIRDEVRALGWCVYDKGCAGRQWLTIELHLDEQRLNGWLSDSAHVKPNVIYAEELAGYSWLCGISLT